MPILDTSLFPSHIESTLVAGGRAMGFGIGDLDGGLADTWICAFCTYRNPAWAMRCPNAGCSSWSVHARALGGFSSSNTPLTEAQVRLLLQGFAI